MAKQIVVKQDDTAPDIVAALTNALGPQDLTGATVQWRMKLSDGSGTAITGNCTIDAPTTAGIVRHDLGTADTIAPGLYVIEWFVTYSNGEKQTFPNDKSTTIKVNPRYTL